MYCVVKLLVLLVETAMQHYGVWVNEGNIKTWLNTTSMITVSHQPALHPQWQIQTISATKKKHFQHQCNFDLSISTRSQDLKFLTASIAWAEPVRGAGLWTNSLALHHHSWNALLIPWNQHVPWHVWINFSVQPWETMAALGVQKWPKSI